MSWLARSLANSLGIDDDGEQTPQSNVGNGSSHNFDKKSSWQDRSHGEVEEEDDDQSRGVKEDLTEFKESLTRQLLGVASFLAPAPPPPPPPPPRLGKYRDQITVSELDPLELSDPPTVSGDDGLSIQDQVGGENGDPSEEVGALDVSGISRVSGNDRVQSVPEDFQLDCNYEVLMSRAEKPDWVYGAVGVTDEVLAFAGNIAHHPETWLDFPIEEEDDADDFELSESQKQHAFSIECLSPRLKALRIELCPALLSEGYFWKVYFVLLHSRLNKNDSKLLSTSQVVEARAKWMLELQKRTKEDLERQRFYKENALLLEDLGTSSPCSQQPDNYSLWAFSSEPACSSISCDSETEKHPHANTETEFVDKLVIEETQVIKTMVDKNLSSVSSNKMLLQSFEDDGENDDDWPEDDVSEDGKGMSAIPSGIEEEVSFSDLEDDDCSIHVKYNTSLKT